MTAATDGLIPPTNIVGGLNHAALTERMVNPEFMDDMIDDVVNEVQGFVGSSEVGRQMAWIEQEVQGRVFRDAYKSYPYVVVNAGANEDVVKAFRMLVDDCRAEVERMMALGFDREHLQLIWRLTNKIHIGENWCRRCGGTIMIRTRYLIRPDREYYFGPALDKDPALVPPA